MKRRDYLRASIGAGAAAICGCLERLDSGSQSGDTVLDSGSQNDEKNTAAPDDSAARTTEDSVGTSAMRSDAVLSGVFTGNPPAELGVFSEWLGHKPTIIVVHVAGIAAAEPWIKEFIEQSVAGVWERGYVPLVIWHPYLSPRERTPENIEVRVANGAFDDTIRTWATHLASWVGGDTPGTRRRRFYFLPAAEMNGSWHPWSAADAESGEAVTAKTGTPEDYVRMWKRLYDFFSEAGMDEHTTQWVWTPSSDQVGGVKTEWYYPGDDYVDWIGINGFNFGDTQPYSQWQTPKERLGSMTERMKALADKPLAFPEFASTSYFDGTSQPRRKAEWIARAFSFITENDIKMACWFNIDATGAGQADWSVFGGTHGTSTYRTNSETYRVYNTYRREVQKVAIRNAHPDHPRILTDDEFAGRF